MSVDALVSIDSKADATRVIQRQVPTGRDNFSESSDLRRTPPLFGLGLIEFSQERIRNGNLQPVFGSLAEHSSLHSFVGEAFAVELGVSSTYKCARHHPAEDYPDKCIPVISDAEVDDVVSFLRFLGAPKQEKHATADQGINVFEAIGCNGCHQQFLRASAEAPKPLAQKKAQAFTDLQRHEIGGRSLIRTPPLWGLNSMGPPYLHDGRAGSIEQAIALHGGEAEPQVRAYRNLSPEKREQLLLFLRSL